MTNSTSIISMSQTDANMAMAEKLTRLERDNAMLKQENDRLNWELAKAQTPLIIIGRITHRFWSAKFRRQSRLL